MIVLLKNLEALYESVRNDGKAWDYNKRPKDIQHEVLDPQEDFVIIIPQATSYMDAAKHEEEKKTQGEIVNGQITQLVENLVKRDGENTEDILPTDFSKVHVLKSNSCTGRFYGALGWGQDREVFRTVLGQTAENLRPLLLEEETPAERYTAKSCGNHERPIVDASERL